jgi:hypothetical protein
MATGPAGPDGVPPAVMLHSFGGSTEVIRGFVKGLPGGVGARIYFSFSSVINGARGGRGRPPRPPSNPTHMRTLRTRTR